MARRLIACLILAFILIISSQILAQAPPPPPGGSGSSAPSMPPMPPGGPPMPPPPPDYNESGRPTNPAQPGAPNGEQQGSQGNQTYAPAQPSAPNGGQQQGNQGNQPTQQRPGTPGAPGVQRPNIPQPQVPGAPRPQLPGDVQRKPAPGAGTLASPQSNTVSPDMPTESTPDAPSTTATGRNWTVFRGDVCHTGATDEQLGFPLKLAWKFITDMTPNNPSSPAVENGVIYFCSGSRLYAVNAETGSLKWRFPAEEYLTATVKSSPVVGPDLVYFGAGDGKLYAVTKDTGNLAWSFATKGIMNSSPILVDGVIYVGSSDDHLYSLDALTGQMKWNGGFRTRDDVATPPAYMDGLIYFLSNDMVLYAAHTATGNIKWQVRVGNWSAASTPVVADNNVYLASGNMVQSFQAKSGRLKWVLKFASDVSTIPAVANGMVFFACRNGNFYGVTTAGKLKWSAELGSAAYGSPIVAGDTVIVGANRGALTAFDVETGSVRWKYLVQPSSTDYGKVRYVNLASSPAVSNGVLYVLADDGALHAFRSDMPDLTAPEITPLTPPRDYLMPGAMPIEFAVLVNDQGSGIQEPTISMTVDGQPVEHKFIAERGIVWHKLGGRKENEKTSDIGGTMQPLKDGLHSATVSVYDWAGNKAETTWHFTVNNRIRKAPKQTTAAPAGAPGGAAMVGAPASR